MSDEEGSTTRSSASRCTTPTGTTTRSSTNCRAAARGDRAVLLDLQGPRTGQARDRRWVGARREALEEISASRRRHRASDFASPPPPRAPFRLKRGVTPEPEGTQAMSTTEREIKQPGPDHPITIEPNPAHITVSLAGRVLAGHAQRADAAGGELSAGPVHPLQRHRPVAARGDRPRDLVPLQGRGRLPQHSAGRRADGQCRLELRPSSPGGGGDQGSRGVLSRPRRDHRRGRLSEELSGGHGPAIDSFAGADQDERNEPGVRTGRAR